LYNAIYNIAKTVLHTHFLKEVVSNYNCPAGAKRECGPNSMFVLTVCISLVDAVPWLTDLPRSGNTDRK
jgi:hypothetical protein